MNERLKELYQQAHMVREYPADDPMRGGNPPTVYWGGDRSAERFAELIVEECAAVCEEIAGMAETTNTGEMARKTRATAISCSNFIKNRFGVK
jgi:hypothetical protein